MVFEGEAGKETYTSAIREFGGNHRSYLKFHNYVLEHGQEKDGAIFVSTAYTRNHVTWWIRGEGTNLKDAKTNFWSLFTNQQEYFRYHPQTAKMHEKESSGSTS